jgi:multiple sugar transport system permease protein
VRRALALAVALVFVAPFALAVLGSMRGIGLPPPRTFDVVPDGVSLEAYRVAGDAMPLARYATNSAIVAVIAVPLGVAVASWAGFAATLLAPRGRRLVVAAAVVALMVPTTALLVGRFALYRVAGATDGLVPLIAPALLGVTPLFVLVYAVAFRRVPTPLFESARELGASPLGVWWRVAMPLVRPVTAAVAALAFAITWGDLTSPTLYVTDERWFTFPVGVAALAGLPPTEQPAMLAAATMAIAPVVVAFVIGQVWLRRKEMG